MLLSFQRLLLCCKVTFFSAAHASSGFPISLSIIPFIPFYPFIHSINHSVIHLIIHSFHHHQIKSSTITTLTTFTHHYHHNYYHCYHPPYYGYTPIEPITPNGLTCLSFFAHGQLLASLIINVQYHCIILILILVSSSPVMSSLLAPSFSSIPYPITYHHSLSPFNLSLPDITQRSATSVQPMALRTDEPPL